ncbi:phytanoyl-CoA dioxygenase [Neokomagataea tanensis NBRC 106556]|uniref:Phytanoyl-CoA dioxygenase n=2 Tax=Acetobacteraceae TaxID=433 RepID=A0ABQ0QHL0_9PROT|nr:phytanoyl-CoA dioxygenase [Neokomagataea tanensis NBRC 106556]
MRPTPLTSNLSPNTTWSPPHEGTPSFADLSEAPNPSLIPPLDRPDINETELTKNQKEWRENGVLIKRNFLPDALMDAYIARRDKLKDEDPNKYIGGWSSPTPYIHVPEIKALALFKPLSDLLEEILTEPAMLHLSLTGWASTERDWHQDDYLNPEHVNGWYLAVWIALGDIHEECGPFEYIPGSHTWPLMRQDKVKRWMHPTERDHRTPEGFDTWPKTSERFVVPAIHNEITERGQATQKFIAKKGDILIWHGRLMHRGSPASAPWPACMRPALICHYSGISRKDMAHLKRQTADGSYYAQFDFPLV